MPTSLFPVSAGSFPWCRPGLALGDPARALCLRVGAGGAAKPRRSQHTAAGSDVAPAPRGRQHVHQPGPARGSIGAAGPRLCPSTPQPLPQGSRHAFTPPTPRDTHHHPQPQPLRPAPRDHDPCTGAARGHGTTSIPAPLPGALQSSPSLLLLPSVVVGAEGSLRPPSPSPSSPGSPPQQPQFGSRGPFPRAAGRTSAHALPAPPQPPLPAANRAAPGTAAAGRQSPTRQSRDLPRRPPACVAKGTANPPFAATG